MKLVGLIVSIHFIFLFDNLIESKMSASNWLSNEEVSPDRNARYRVDNVALQLRLGLPIEVIGISPRDFNRSHFSGK